MFQRRMSQLRRLAMKRQRTRGEQAAARRFLSILKSDAKARLTKLKCVKRSVKVRAYENDLKLSIAIDRMARELAG